MRKTYHIILKQCFCIHLLRIRTKQGVTQAEMAERLAMDERSYVDLDHGKTCCSAVTLALFLVYVCEDVYGFLEELRHEFEASSNAVA